MVVEKAKRSRTCKNITAYVVSAEGQDGFQKYSSGKESAAWPSLHQRLGYTSIYLLCVYTTPTPSSCYGPSSLLAIHSVDRVISLLFFVLIHLILA